MATPSPEPRPSWQQLTASAREAGAPADIDVRAAIRAEITSQPPQAAASTVPGLMDDLLDLFQARWLRVGLAALSVVAFVACRDGLDVMNELAFVWQFQGPVISGI